MPQLPTPTQRSGMIAAAVLLCGVLLILFWRAQAAPEPLGSAVLVEQGEPAAGTVPSDSTPRPSESGQSAPPAVVTVHVAGPVVRPGVVQLPAGSRVADAVAACGGVLPGAELGAVNLARPLADGERVDVGASTAEAAATAGGPGGSGTAEQGGSVDLNSADSARLQELPGVGPVLAQRILDYRQEIGRFDSVEQLREVSGIGEARFAELRDQVTVSP